MISVNTRLQLMLLRMLSPNTVEVAARVLLAVPPLDPVTTTPREAQARDGYDVPRDAHRQLREKQRTRVFGEGRPPSDEGHHRIAADPGYRRVNRTAEGRRAKHLGPERRRPQVLDAALSIAAEHGIAGITMAAVSERMGVSRPVVYDCFPGRGEVLAALLDRETEVALSRLVAILPPLKTGSVEQMFVDGFASLLADVVRAAGLMADHLRQRSGSRSGQGDFAGPGARSPRRWPP